MEAMQAQLFTMSQSNHTYGPTCHLARNVTPSRENEDDIPDLRPQFFYCSPLPIDDPLSAVPPPAGSDSKSVKHPLRPFSPYDNNALEEAWLGLASDKDRKNHNKGKLPMLSGRLQSGRYELSGDTPTAKHSKRRISNNNKKGTFDSGPSTAPATSGGGKKEDVTPASASATSNIKGGKKKVISERNLRRNESSAPAPDSINAPSREESEGACPCKCNHEDCQYTEGQCPCSTCPQGSNVQNASKASDSSSSKKLAADSGHQEQPYSQVNTTEISCEDPDHTTGDAFPTSLVPSCCSDLERHSRRASRQASRQDNNLGDKSSPEIDPAQQDDAPQETAGKKKKAEKPKSKGNDKKEHTAISDLTFSQRDRPNDGVSKGTESPSYTGREQSKDAEDVTLLDVINPTVVGRAKLVKKIAKSNMAKYDPQPPQSNNASQQGDEVGTTGQPFLKYSSPDDSAQQPTSSKSNHDDGENQNPSLEHSSTACETTRREHERDSTETESLSEQTCKAYKNTKDEADVPVGFSRLHLVKLPALQMKPIYWSPVHDIAAVCRGTWFYRDTMYPVEPAVANQLEMGYRELRPWSRTWRDELNSAIEVGADGEEKISHPLWPQTNDQNGGFQNSSSGVVSTGPYCAARCFQGEAAAEGTVDSEDPGEKYPTAATLVKKYPHSHVIYKDGNSAFILKPNLQPSAYYGRKPLQKIKRGMTVGIHVVRGFDWRTWDKLHPSKKSDATTKAEEFAPVAGDADASKRNACAACKSQEARPKVTDLVLVIHGIGQKLSERVESFHFTHAINAFRRSVNVELGNDAVRRVYRHDLGGVMVLPVNWRSSLSFEDGGPMKDGDKDHRNAEFSLTDITPKTIPAVRNIISDVMLDIPFYMSHHKPKMIRAVICEANRVYRLWCKNNPEFHEEGRVHIIAHSLGSAMALEVLSKQPTSVPRVDLREKKINAKYFDFNTTNLFCAGSPAGFFLLLDKGCLVPRCGQNKPGVEHGDDVDPKLVGNAGTFGCLAVNNIYNIMHYNDPIAYRLNATVDPQYAASLKNAQVPSATTGFFESIGNAVKSMTPGVSAPADLAVGQMAKPAGVARLPSQMEMAVHDFSREEMAEKKCYLLNDNGQIDWFLSSGGGPLEIQYINMLGAHSSYWTSPDFVRFIVTEVGREPGRGHTLPNMRAVKIGHKPS